MAVFIVTTLDDEVVANGTLSLREAVDLANAVPGSDTIQFDPTLSGGQIRLTQGEIAIGGDLVVDGDIDGDGGPDIAISGDALGNDVTTGGGLTDVAASLASNAALLDGIDNDGDGPVDGADPGADEDLLDDNSRIFRVTDFLADVTLNGLVLTGGRTTGAFQDGGAVLGGYGALVIRDSLLRGNSTEGQNSEGGAVSGRAVSITNSTISHNATSGDQSDGGGIYAGTLQLIDSTVSDNRTFGLGATGGGVAGYGALVIDSTVSDNATSADSARGGGIAISSDSLLGLVLTNSLIRGNATDGFSSSGGGAWAPTIRAHDSTVSMNSSSGFMANGGGLYGFNLKLTNTTVSGNSATGADVLIATGATDDIGVLGVSPGSGAVGGGGVFASSRFEGTHVTITGNAVTNFEYMFQQENEIAPLANPGGGQYVGAGLQLGFGASGQSVLSNSIVLGNAAAVTPIEFGPPVFLQQTMTGPHEIGAANPFSAIDFRGQNIVGADMLAFDATAGNPIIASGADKVENADPLTVFDATGEVVVDSDGDGVPDLASGVVAGALADNGGRVPTVALRRDGANPALDRADASITLNLDESLIVSDLNADGDLFDFVDTVSELRFDARGAFHSRDLISTPQGNTPDLGAFELQVPPAFAIAAVDADRAEGDAATTVFTFEVTRTVKLDGPVTLDFAVTGFGANPADAQDFSGGALPEGTVAFDDLQQTATIEIAVRGDTGAEADEDFRLTLSNPQGDPLGGDLLTPAADGVIRNDDAPPSLAIAAVSNELAELQVGATSFVFEVVRSGNASGAATVDFAVTGFGPPATAPDDFVGGAFPSGTLSFAAGETRKLIVVDIQGDVTDEPDEGFLVTISNPSDGAPITVASSNGTVLNDDDQPQPANLAPMAVDDFVVTPAGTPIVIDATANDTDPENDPLTVTALGTDPAQGGIPENGIAAISGQGQITYTPDPGFEGAVDFSYEIGDGNANTDTARVTVLVGSPPPPSPVAGNLRGTGGEDALLLFGAANYLGGGGQDIYLATNGLQPGATAVISDGDGLTDSIQLAEGLAIAAFTLFPNALQLTLFNGATVQVLGADGFDFESGANVTVGDSGTLQDFATFASQTLGVPVPTSGSASGGPVVIADPAGVPEFPELAEDLLL